MIDKKIRLALTAILLTTVFHAMSQGYPETAFLFSRNRPAGSARVQALGGAQTALGGDYSSAQSNPAGLGLYNRSEFTFSLGMNNANVNSFYNPENKSSTGRSTSSNTSTLNLPGLSYVFNMPKDNGDSFLGGTFGVSLSRINDFNQTFEYGAYNPNSSIVDHFIDKATGHTTYQFEDPNGDTFNPDSAYFNKYNDPTGLAYYNYLLGPTSSIDPANPTTRYFTDAGYGTQHEKVTTGGAANQWSFSYAGNFSDKFFVGGGIGVVSLRYKSKHLYSETFVSDTLRALQLEETTNMRGSGLNATIGAIVKPVDFLQFGASYKTPTYFGITETYEASMGTNWNHFDYYGDQTKYLDNNLNDPVSTDLVTADYGLVTPGRLSAGVAAMSKIGFITADVEFVNPSNAKYKGGRHGLEFSQENSAIRSFYKSSVNYRVGAEARYKILRIRGGYNLMSNSYNSDITSNNKVTSISGGLGIRKDTFFIDFALVQSSSKNLYSPYTFSDGSGPVVSQRNKITTGMVTVGFIF
jgi:hypothetical protein